MTLNELIKTKRIEKGLSQRELGEMLGYTGGQYIHNAELGKCGFSLNKAKELCKILRIKKGEFKHAYLKRYEKRIDRALKWITKPGFM